MEYKGYTITIGHDAVYVWQYQTKIYGEKVHEHKKLIAIRESEEEAMQYIKELKRD